MTSNYEHQVKARHKVQKEVALYLSIVEVMSIKELELASARLADYLNQEHGLLDDFSHVLKGRILAQHIKTAKSVAPLKKVKRALNLPRKEILENIEHSIRMNIRSNFHEEISNIEVANIEIRKRNNKKLMEWEQIDNNLSWLKKLVHKFPELEQEVPPLNISAKVTKELSFYRSLSDEELLIFGAVLFNFSHDIDM